MAGDKASAFSTISWYLIARDGHLSARVHPGMCLGEDEGGELSLKREHGLLELDIEDGRLRLKMLSPRHELLVPEDGSKETLIVSPQTPVSIRLPSNRLSVDTNFATDAPYSEVLELEVVEIPVVGSVDSALRAAARGPESAEPREQLEAPAIADAGVSALRFQLVEEVADEAGTAADGEELLSASVARLQDEHKRAALEKRSQTPAAVTRLRRELGDPRRASALFLAAVAAGFLLLILQSGPESRPVPVLAPTAASAVATAGEAEPAESATAAPLAEETSSTAAPAGTDLAPAGVEASALEADDVAVAETATDAAAPATPEPATFSAEDSALLANVTALLAGDDLPPKASLDFAVQTLESLRAAYPQDAVVRDSLEALTLRLTEEARLSFDRGELLRAGRLIEQASSTGLAQEAVAATLADLEAPRPATAERAAPELADSAPLDAGDPVAEESAALPAAAELPDAEVAAAFDALNERAQGASELPEASEPPEASAPVLDAGLSEELDTLASNAPTALPVGGEPLDPLAPGPEYTGGDEAPAAFVSTLAGADPELSAVLDEALGLVSAPPAAPEPNGPEREALYPFAQLSALSLDPPRYPRRALDGVDGSVDLELTVTPSGRVEDVEVLSGGPSYFKRAAVRAARAWRFQPVRRGGQAVPVRTRVRLTFEG